MTSTDVKTVRLSSTITVETYSNWNHFTLIRDRGADLPEACITLPRHAEEELLELLLQRKADRDSYKNWRITDDKTGVIVVSSIVAKSAAGALLAAHRSNFIDLDNYPNEVTVKRVDPNTNRLICDRCGGVWGEDLTCSDCTDEDGNPRKEI